MRQGFKVYACRTFTVEGCATKNAEESRGLRGFHDFHRCPACKVISTGVEFWGENGHLQGRCDEIDLDTVSAHRTATRGEVIESGADTFYVGPYSDAIGPMYGIPERAETKRPTI